MKLDRRSLIPSSYSYLFLIGALLLAALGSLHGTPSTQAAAGLSVAIVAGPNLVVDSNVKAPSTYGPAVATVMGQFCNTGSATNGDPAITDVVGYIGDYVSAGTSTPGIYPSRTIGTSMFPGTYAFEHLGATTDAARYIGTLQPGECSNQYWHFTYPRCANNDDGSAKEPPCFNDNEPTWGSSVKPDDDLWLTFDMWGTAASG